MKLIEAIEKLNQLDRDATICVRRPWTGDAECVVIVLDPEARFPKAAIPAGFEYFLEVDIAFEALEVFGKHQPTTDEKRRLIIYYAENDAFPEWAYKLQR